uniref:Ig-like domain-containing protein n=1 Tax=Stegastes partitus TaxID=144197 RepID=A0A3B5AAR4_9TELE
MNTKQIPRVSLTTLHRAAVHLFNVCLADEDCADKPVFSPSTLTVKYGDRVSARCTACQNACQKDQTNLDVSIGHARKDGNLILWKVASMTAWNPSATCYYIKDDGSMCCNHLPVTVYSKTFGVNYYGLDSEGSQYSLKCMVYDVAPVEHLTVTFYRGSTVLGQLRSNNTSKTPVTEAFTLYTDASTEYNSTMYWCDAKMDLGPEEPQRSLVAKSTYHEVMVSSATVIQKLPCLFRFGWDYVFLDAWFVFLALALPENILNMMNWQKYRCSNVKKPSTFTQELYSSTT